MKASAPYITRPITISNVCKATRKFIYCVDSCNMVCANAKKYYNQINFAVTYMIHDTNKRSKIRI